jgi:hypothetical protein
MGGEERSREGRERAEKVKEKERYLYECGTGGHEQQQEDSRREKIGRLENGRRRRHRRSD